MIGKDFMDSSKEDFMNPYKNFNLFKLRKMIYF